MEHFISEEKLKKVRMQLTVTHSVFVLWTWALIRIIYFSGPCVEFKPFQHSFYHPHPSLRLQTSSQFFRMQFPNFCSFPCVPMNCRKIKHAEHTHVKSIYVIGCTRLHEIILNAISRPALVINFTDSNRVTELWSSSSTYAISLILRPLYFSA